MNLINNKIDQSVLEFKNQMDEFNKQFRLELKQEITDLKLEMGRIKQLIGAFSVLNYISTVFSTFQDLLSSYFLKIINCFINI